MALSEIKKILLHMDTLVKEIKVQKMKIEGGKNWHLIFFLQ